MCDLWGREGPGAEPDGNGPRTEYVVCFPVTLVVKSRWRASRAIPHAAL